MPAQLESSPLEAVVRALATASRALRLYPAASPIPSDAIRGAEEAIRIALTAEPEIVLSIERDGLSSDGVPLGKHTPGSKELADELRGHGVSEVGFLHGVFGEEIMRFIALTHRDPTEVVAEGGFSTVLRVDGVEGIRVAEVQLTVVDSSLMTPEEDVDEFLRMLAEDSSNLGLWLSTSASNDPGVFEEGLVELVRAVGPEGQAGLAYSLAKAFEQEPQETREMLLRLAMHPGVVQDLVGSMVPHVSTDTLADTLVEGTFGLNMLALSAALTRLPLDRAIAEVRAKTQAKLAEQGHQEAELSFLDRMIATRESRIPEPPLDSADRTYRAVAAAAAVSDADIEQVRFAVASAGENVDAVGVRTMLVLLDREKDFDLYCTTADSLAALVPRLIEERQLALASAVLKALYDREEEAVGPWPELSARLHEAIASAVGPRSMTALVSTLASDPSLMPAAREIVRFAGDAGDAPLVAQAILMKEPGLQIADDLIGRRVIPELQEQAPRVPWHLLGPIVVRLGEQTDPRSQNTIESLLQRADEPSRREVVTALGSVPGVTSTYLLGRALKDESVDVSVAAARSLGKNGDAQAARALADRLTQLEIDGEDFALAREVIISLGRIKSPVSVDALTRVVSRRTFIKRAKYNEIQGLAQQALRQQEGAA